MDERAIKVREISILRLIYECGMISLELMDRLFRKKRITKEDLRRRIREGNNGSEKAIKARGKRQKM
jgi:hypothetical protein